MAGNEMPVLARSGRIVTPVGMFAINTLGVADENYVFTELLTNTVRFRSGSVGNENRG